MARLSTIAVTPTSTERTMTPLTWVRPSLARINEAITSDTITATNTTPRAPVIGRDQHGEQRYCRAQRERQPGRRRDGQWCGPYVTHRQPVLDLDMGCQRVRCGQFARHLPGQIRDQPSRLVQRGELGHLLLRGQAQLTPLLLDDGQPRVEFGGFLGVLRTAEGDPAGDHRGERGDHERWSGCPRAGEPLDDPGGGDDPVVGLHQHRARHGCVQPLGEDRVPADAHWES